MPAVDNPYSVGAVLPGVDDRRFYWSSALKSMHLSFQPRVVKRPWIYAGCPELSEEGIKSYLERNPWLSLALQGSSYLAKLGSAANSSYFVVPFGDEGLPNGKGNEVGMCVCHLTPLGLSRGIAKHLEGIDAQLLMNGMN